MAPITYLIGGPIRTYSHLEINDPPDLPKGPPYMLEPPTVWWLI